LGRGQYVVRRLLALVPVWLGATALTFVIIHSIPGGPFDTGSIRSAQATANIRQLYHVNRPLPEQYVYYMWGVAHGNLGESMVQRGLTVSSVIADRFPTSAKLGAAALLVSLGVGIPAGLLSAVYRRRIPDYVLMTGASIGYAIPNFVLSILLILLFGLQLGWLPVGGWGSPSQVVLPAVALGLPWAGLIARMTRAATLDTLNRDYVRTAVAKGAGPVRVVLRHAFRNALLPLTTIIAVIASEVITGSLVVENIFGIPGLGHYVTDAVLGSDYTMTLGLVVFYSAMVFLANLLVDITYSLLDPTVGVE
jgi:oligopeptide transport system permease protein